MANLLDEMNDPVLEEGRDTGVIAKRIPVKVGFGSTLFEIMLWVLGIIPGIIFLVKKIKAKNYFYALEQKLQHNASQIDNYLEQRVMILQNCAKLVDKAVGLDKETFSNIAMYRSGNTAQTDEARNEIAGKLDGIGRSINNAWSLSPTTSTWKSRRNPSVCARLSSTTPSVCAFGQEKTRSRITTRLYTTN